MNKTESLEVLEKESGVNKEEEKKELDLIVTEAKEITINTDADLKIAVDFLKQLKEFKIKLDARHVPVKKAAHETYKLACNACC